MHNLSGFRVIRVNPGLGGPTVNDIQKREGPYDMRIPTLQPETRLRVLLLSLALTYFFRSC